MNRKLFTTAVALLAAGALQAQTLNVVVGSVTYQVPAAQAGEMVYQDGQTVSIMNKTYTLANVDQMYIDNTAVTDYTVQVEYSGTTAQVKVAGNVAKYVDVSVSGAHVGIVQSEPDAEITYTLSGTATDGEFYLEGDYKATVELDGLTLTNLTPQYSGAAIYVKDGKRIDISVKKDTENTLTDCSEPGDAYAQKGCLWVKGHAELKGKGVLNINGRYAEAHGVKTGEYMTMKNCTLNILAAGKDGLHVNEYFLMESGTLTVSGVGDDALQAELDGTTNTGETTDHEDEDSGNIYIDGGTLTLTTTAAGTKGLKSDSTVVVNGGTLTINASGTVDTSDASDPSYVAGIGAGKYVQNGGTVAITVKGTAGRGVKAWDIETNGGELTIVNSAAPTTVSSDVKGAKGLKALNMALNAGTITITMSGNASKAIRCGDGTQSASGGGGGWRAPGGGGGWGPGGPGGGGGMGGGSKWTNVTGSYTQGKSDGTGPTLTVSQKGSAYSSSSAKAIKAICAVTLYGGTTEVETTSNGAEGLESKTSIDIRGGQHYFKCYDDCLNSAGKISFNGGVTVAYSTGNDVIDSNAGTTGAITIGNGSVLAYMTKGDPDEAFDCDNNNYIQITGTGIAIGAGGAQSSTTGTISNAAQGYAFPGTVRFTANAYNTLADAEGNNLVTFQLPVTISSRCTFITAKGMVSKGTYNIKSSTTEPTDATTAWHGLYIGSSAKGTTSVVSAITAK